MLPLTENGGYYNNKQARNYSTTTTVGVLPVATQPRTHALLLLRTAVGEAERGTSSTSTSTVVATTTVGVVVLY